MGLIASDAPVPSDESLGYYHTAPDGTSATRQPRVSLLHHILGLLESIKYPGTRISGFRGLGSFPAGARPNAGKDPLSL